MLNLSFSGQLNNYISKDLIRPPPFEIESQLLPDHFNFRRSFMNRYLKRYREMISLRGLTDHTMKSYTTYISAYLDYLDHVLKRAPRDVTWNQLRDFIRYIQKERGLSDRTINTAISQLRFFTIYVLHKEWDDSQLPMRRFDTYLPYVPTEKQVWDFISTMTDLKQKTMVAIMYSAGLRIGEVCHLRYEDIDRTNMRIHIAHTKGRNDRYAILSKTALDLLTEYWFAYRRPMNWLFPQQWNRNSDRPISTNFLTRRIHDHERALGWEEKLTCHSFRHAFGTHLYENGTDLLTIKALLGHRSLNSTTIYVHLANNSISNAISPLDRIAGGHHVQD